MLKLFQVMNNLKKWNMMTISYHLQYLRWKPLRIFLVRNIMENGIDENEEDGGISNIMSSSNQAFQAVETP